MAKEPQNTVTLPAVIDLDALDPVRETLLAAVERGPVAVSGVEVERVSTNALIMLLSAAESARRTGYEFAITGPSAAMLAAIERLGLGGQFAAVMEG
jgi:anti-anti-sigma regulatory factor